MNVVFTSQRWKLALVYLDGIVIIASPAQYHIEKMSRVLPLLYQAGFSLKLKECRFLAKIFDYFRQIIPLGSLKLAEHTTDGFAKLKEITTQTELRFFLDLHNLFRWIVQNMALLAAFLGN